MLLVVGASAVVDRRDVGPAGIVRAGGEILHFGMPVDPGNLICLGRIGAHAALVLPGCARSPKLNGIDFILPRMFAGLAVGPADFMSLGVGGLLKETDARQGPIVEFLQQPADAHAHDVRRLTFSPANRRVRMKSMPFSFGLRAQPGSTSGVLADPADADQVARIDRHAEMHDFAAGAHDARPARRRAGPPRPRRRPPAACRRPAASNPSSASRDRFLVMRAAHRRQQRAGQLR